ncbi:winged helix-turn-helix transcriptional regulator [Nonomuraea rhodomycinica]|uniref:winged helix-turn-helix transcriptional regulator n=1 Tax=Nonomuraea rhodomycinica TaxID=1712872 RepID=UPI001C375970|nr:helix-turn-helix domain-containing protein [Nonomuraea rhodomycinica]
MDAQPRISSVNCSVSRALAVVGERWTLLIVREAFDGVRRFADFRARLGIASNLLAARLDTLVDTGVMRRVPYREPGGRQRFEYELTPRGADLRPVLVALLQWGDKYLADPEGPSVIVRHRAGPGETACEEPVRVVLECAAGHSALPPDSLRRAPGPGAHLIEP